MRQQRGVAIILAILIVALATVITAFITWQTQLWVRQAENLTAMTQARTVAAAAIDWARLVLQEDKKNDGAAGTDNLGETWASSLAPTGVERGQFTGGIRDLQSLYNLNNLSSTDSENAFDAGATMLKRLFAQLEIPEELINALKDWTDADQQVSFPGGAEDLDYLGMQAPYRAANQLLTSVDSLHRIKGFEAKIIDKLRPYVTALPNVQAKINVNTAPPELIAAMFEGMSDAMAKQLVEEREKEAFKTVEDFKTKVKGMFTISDEAMTIVQQKIDVKSNYFLITALTKFDRVEFGYQALVDRSAAGAPKVLWQRQQ